MGAGRFVEQADGHSKRAGSYHGVLKRAKARSERRVARRALRELREPEPSYGKYKGWET